YERPPLPRREDQSRAVRVLTVAHGDDSRQVGRHLDALAVVTAGGRLAPFRILEIHEVHVLTASSVHRAGRGSCMGDSPPQVAPYHPGADHPRSNSPPLAPSTKALHSAGVKINAGP